MSKQAVVDLKNTRWGAQIQSAKDEEDMPWRVAVAVSRDEQGVVEPSMTLDVAGKEVTLNVDQMADLCGHIITGLWFTLELPAEQVPGPLKGQLQPSTMWAALQARNIMPLILQRLTGQTVVAGKPFEVAFSYMPNVKALALVGANGDRKQTWDGSFRPILTLQEVRDQVEYTGPPA